MHFATISLRLTLIFNNATESGGEKPFLGGKKKSVIGFIQTHRKKRSSLRKINRICKILNQSVFGVLLMELEDKELLCKQVKWLEAERDLKRGADEKMQRPGERVKKL